MIKLIEESWKDILKFIKNLFYSIGQIINLILKIVTVCLSIIIICILPIIVGAILLFVINNNIGLFIFVALSIFNISIWLQYIFKILNKYANN